MDKTSIAALLMTLTIVACSVCALKTAPTKPIVEERVNPPSVCTDGLATPRRYDMLFSEDDLHALASTIAGEAGFCSWEQQCMVGWVVVNRFDRGYASTIANVCRAPGQFHGYGITPTEQNIKAAYSVLHRWSLEQQGREVDRELSPEYLWFCATGDGITNTFRSVY